MCGIAGIYHFTDPAGIRPKVLAGMLDRLAARGPDDLGQWSEQSVELGHRRLAVLNLSSAGHQPMLSACDRYVVSLNGEVYNHRELADELGIDRARLRSTSDTEVLLEAWTRLGSGALSRMVGQWAFALYDRRERALWLVRDRFGEKPLFYHQSPARLTFGSSIAALLAAPWVPRSLDQQALVEYATLRYVVSPRTVMADIAKLPPGHLMRVSEAGVEISRWYDLPEKLADRPTASRDPLEELDHLLRQATRRCLVSDVPTALFLSDGIDSHSIQAAADRPLQSFTYVDGDGPSDAPGPLHRDIRVSSRQRARDIDSACRALTEPVGDGVALATWQLVRAAREHATVFLCGHGGDEVMGGYRLNRDLLALRALHALRWLPGALSRGYYDRSLNGWGTFETRLSRFRQASRREAPAAARYLIHRPLRASDLRQIFGTATDVSDSLGSIDRVYDECPPQAGDFDRLQTVMLRTFLSENLLSFADSAGMASGAEIRLPFLDRDLVEFVLGLPARYRVRARPGRANNKILLRRWAGGRLDRAVIRRKKRGFDSGSLTELLRLEPWLRSRLLDTSELRQTMPGLEGWLARDDDFYKRARGGTLWAVVHLGLWYAGLTS